MRSIDTIFDSPMTGPTAPSQAFSCFACALARLLFRIFYRFECENVEQTKALLQEQACVIASNHQSYFDPVFIILALRPHVVRFMCRDDFFRFSVLGRMVALVGAFPVKRDSADRTSLRRAAAALKRGESVGIFPEGTRMKGQPGKERDIHAGVTLVARMSNVPILPAAIVGAEKICPYGAHVPRAPKVTVRFGEPLDPALFNELPRDERNRACANEVMRQVDDLRAGASLEEVRAGMLTRQAAAWREDLSYDQEVPNEAASDEALPTEAVPSGTARDEALRRKSL